MRALLTAVIAAIEAAAVALAVFALIGVPAVLIWWLGFDLGAEPAALASIVAALWQMAFLAPMQVSVSAPAALALGLPATALEFSLSLAPLALTLGVALLGYRAGSRVAARGGTGVWAVLGGGVGFALAAGFTGALAGQMTVWPQWARIVVPTSVYLLPMLLGFVLRAARDDHDWWDASVRGVQQLVAHAAPNSAAAFPERAAEVGRLGVAALAALLALGSLGVMLAIVVGYVDIITLSQGLQLDAPGALALFLVHLAFLPTAWVWAVSWFAGSGFAVGAATSVSPFDTLLGPLPALPIFGALPASWGWWGGLAPILIVVIGTVLGGLAGGRPLMRRASATVSVLIPVLAALLAGLVVALFCVLATGSLGPGRLAVNGPGWWQTGGLVAIELAFGLSLGVFARRFDVARLRAVVPTGLLDEGAADLPLTEDPPRGWGGRVRQSDLADAHDLRDEDLNETVPLEPLAATVADNYPATEEGSPTTEDDYATAEIDALDRPDPGSSEPALAPGPISMFGLGSEPELLQSREVPKPDPQSAAAAVAAAQPPAAAAAAEAAEAADTTEPAEAAAAPMEPVEATEPADAVDPLLKAFSWEAEQPKTPAPAADSDWRSRLRAKWGRE